MSLSSETVIALRDLDMLACIQMQLDIEQEYNFLPPTPIVQKRVDHLRNCMVNSIGGEEMFEELMHDLETVARVRHYATGIFENPEVFLIALESRYIKVGEE